VGSAARGARQGFDEGVALTMLRLQRDLHRNCLPKNAFSRYPSPA
jgi:hypothetical protein